VSVNLLVGGYLTKKSNDKYREPHSIYIYIYIYVCVCVCVYTHTYSSKIAKFEVTQLTCEYEFVSWWLLDEKEQR
jgi:hypothetical protein